MVCFALTGVFLILDGKLVERFTVTAGGRESDYRDCTNTFKY